jgi:hypothetical protein
MTFARPVVIETNVVGRHRVVGSVREAAECLVSGWPHKGRGRAYLVALSLCHETLVRDGDAEPARQAFIAAANEVGVFVREAPSTG